MTQLPSKKKELVEGAGGKLGAGNACGVPACELRERGQGIGGRRTSGPWLVNHRPGVG